MGFLKSFAKYILFFFNFLIVLAAIILIAFGAIQLKNESKLNGTSITDFSLGGFAIAVGVIIFAIAFFGCCGAIKENSCLLNTYAVILVCLLILQIVLAAFAFKEINSDKINEKVTKILLDIWGQDNNTDSTKDIEKNFDCCGPEANYPACFSRNLQPCNKAVTDWTLQNLKGVGGVAVAFAVVELVGAIFACMVKP